MRCASIRKGAHYKMKYRYVIIFLVCIPVVLNAKGGIDSVLRKKFSAGKLSESKNLQDLSGRIGMISSDRTEQLNLLLLWADSSMAPDSARFFYGSGKPMGADEAIEKRRGLCYEYSNILGEFCRLLDIPCFKVEGYVRYYGYKSGDTFRETNHQWNAVKIDSVWKLCDLFWSCVYLKTKSTDRPYLAKRLDDSHYLADPADFIGGHLPADPVFQFSHFPVTVNSFMHDLDSVETLPYVSFTDSIARLASMPEKERELSIARHAYDYNAHNPDILIAAYYNYAVWIFNNSASSGKELKKARAYFVKAQELIPLTQRPHVRALDAHQEH